MGFRQKLNAWEKATRDWNAKVNAYKGNLAKKEADKKKKEAAKLAKAKLAEKKAAEAAKDGDKKEEEAKPMEVDDEEEEVPEVKVDLLGLDVFEVEDVNDVGGGMPLMRDFTPAEWAILNLRYEFHLL